MTSSLHDLALKYGTDKAVHGFCPFYERFFGPIRDEVEKLLEIGVFTGASLRMWGEYFPNATIVGMDAPFGSLYGYAQMAQWPHDPKFRYYLGDQENPDDLARVVDNQGPFDIVVDDGGHTMGQQKTSLRELYPHVTRYYVLEDLQTSFMAEVAFGVHRPGELGAHQTFRYLTGADTEQTAYEYLREHHPDTVLFDRDGDRRHITAVIAAKGD